MTPSLLLVALAAVPLQQGPPPPPIGDLVPLPADRTPAIRVEAFERAVLVELPRAAVRAAAAAARRAPRSVCPEIEELPDAFRLKCRSTHLSARLIRRGKIPLLEITESSGLPTSGDDGPPLVAWNPVWLKLKETCPGRDPAMRGECALMRRDLDAARAAFEAIVDGPSRPHAALRLGDLDLAAGDLESAAGHWQEIQADPWLRVATARLCELDSTCLTPESVPRIYDPDGLPPPLARDMRLRQARALAFLGRPADAARLLLLKPGPRVTCHTAGLMCQDIALAGLRTPNEHPTDGILLWTELPEHGTGSRAYEAELAVAWAARDLGATLFAANVLSAAAKDVPPDHLEAHLLETAELYLAAGDLVRGEVVLEFARSRAGGRKLRGPRWAAVSRAVAGKPRTAPAPARRPAGAPDADIGKLLAAAGEVSQSAQAFLQDGKEPTP